MIFKNVYLSYSMISNHEPGTSKRTVSIKRHGFNFFKKSLLSVLYDLFLYLLRFLINKTAMIFKNLYLSYSMISNQEPGTSKRTVSIKRHGLNFFKKSLLNVLYDLKNQGLNALTSVSCNRVMRVSSRRSS